MTRSDAPLLSAADLVAPFHLDAGPGGQLARISARSHAAAQDGAPPFRQGSLLQYAGGPWVAHLSVGAAVLLSDPEVLGGAAVAVVTDVIGGPGETLVSVLVVELLN